MEACHPAPLLGERLVGVECYGEAGFRRVAIETAYGSGHAHRHCAADIVAETSLIAKVVEYSDCRRALRAEEQREGCGYY